MARNMKKQQEEVIDSLKTPISTPKLAITVKRSPDIKRIQPTPVLNSIIDRHQWVQTAACEDLKIDAYILVCVKLGCDGERSVRS